MSVKSEQVDDDPDWAVDIHARRPSRRAKRRKTVSVVDTGVQRSPSTSVDGAEAAHLAAHIDGLYAHDAAFEDLLGQELHVLIEERRQRLQDAMRPDAEGTPVRPFTRGEQHEFLFDHVVHDETISAVAALALRKIKLSQERNSARLPPLAERLPANPPEARPLAPLATPPPPDPAVLAALHAVRSTPFEHSFLSRLHGAFLERPYNVMSVDWATRAPWMDLMADVRDHYAVMHPDRNVPDEAEAPIEYISLHRDHLPQVHDLLCRAFWPGIDVSDSLRYSPERCTVVAVYKRLVVGVALLSEPQHAYMTYLAVRAGWERAHIATTMLYQLVTLNPHQDITLHVSANNPAMLLYNRFGFKAEAFVAGFYDAYLDPHSRQSKNAILLRLRR